MPIRTLCVVFLFSICILTTNAQTSRCSGKVVDSSGAALSGVRVSVSPHETENVTSLDNGEFFLALPPGAYTLTAAKEGFTTAQQALFLPLCNNDGLVITLQVAPISDSVTVSERFGYQLETSRSATKTLTPLRDVPQSVTVITRELIRDRMLMSIADVVQYVPGITSHQGENNRDQVVIRGNSSSADFFVDGVRDDVQYFRDLYNLERVEAIKGPNAMIFGRGGGGGVINRVTKEAGFMPLHEVTLQGGSFGNKRFTADLNQPFGNRFAFRLNGLYENSNSFRRYVELDRSGISPTLTFMPTAATKIRVNYEYLRDHRVADRGIPSFAGRPLDVDTSTFFGNPDQSKVRSRVNLGAITLEHQAGRVNLRNHTLIGDYDRGYQNFVPGAVTADKTLVALSSYNNATARRNVFNQTDVSATVATGSIRHMLLAGTEIGRQQTDNFRNTGFFQNTATVLSVGLQDSVDSTPVTYRQSASDADNHVGTTVAATYVQDQAQVTRWMQVVGGVRFDHFDLRYRNNRRSQELRRIDNMVSPRVGLVLKPTAALSLYGTFSISYLPSSGDQFSSLTTITQQVKPEKFSNYEAGVKWDVNRALSVTTAVYRLDRDNTRATDPNDPTRILQTGSQRTQGYEFGANGNITRRWQVAGGYAYQDAFIHRVTTSALTGAQVAQVPHHTFSMWNHYRLLPRLGAGVGVQRRTDMFAAVDNTVVLPAYTRVDAAVYFSLSERVRLQANVENLLNTRYYVNADGNNNISPGSSRAVRIGLTARF